MAKSNLIPDQIPFGNPWIDIIINPSREHQMYAVTGTDNVLPQGGQVDISGTGAVFVPPTTAQAVTVQSDNAADTFGGAGTQLVQVNYLDENRDAKSELVTMNGTTPVALSENILRARQMLGLLSPTAPNKKNVGTITLEDAGGQVWLEMKPEKNNTFNAFYSPPNGFTAYAVHVATTLAKNDEAEFEPWLILPDGTEVSGQPFALFEGSLDRELLVPFPIPDNQDIAFRGQSLSAGTANTSIIVSFLEVKN